MNKEQLANRAAAILDDEIYKDAWATIKTRTIKNWEHGDSTREEREAYYYKIKALNEIQAEIKHHITNYALMEGKVIDPFEM